MFEFAQLQNRVQNHHSVSPVKPDFVNSRHAPARRPYHSEQQTWGNQTLQRLLRARAIQAKLTINQPDDKYELEADRVAEQVIRMPDEALPHNADDTTIVQQKGAAWEGGGVFHSECAGEAKGLNIQAWGEDYQAPTLTSTAAAEIYMLLQGGQPLPSSSRAFFETRFGRDFSAVRLHTGQMATNAANTVNAKAFTFGQDIVFGAGYYVPQSTTGQRLMAHELAHVVQQQGLNAQDQRLQRQGDDTSGPDIVTAGGEMVPEPEPPPLSFGPGLPQPDCSTHVDNVFDIGAITYTVGPECNHAYIRDLRNPQLGYKFYRADPSLAGTPRCPDKWIEQMGHWLGNEWNIAEIGISGIKVINLCGDEETLGFNKGCKCPPPKNTPPERTINVTSSFGKGRVYIFDKCHTVQFQSDDCCDVKEYKLNDDAGLWFLQGTEQITAYPPEQLSGFLTVNIHDRQNCGNRYKPEPRAPLELEEGGW